MPDQFWELTLREFFDAYKGFEYRQELEWQRAREIMAFIHNSNPYLKNGTRKRGFELVPLPSDKLLKEQAMKPKSDVKSFKKALAEIEKIEKNATNSKPNS